MVVRLGLVGRGRWGGNIERTLLTFPDVVVTVLQKGAPRPEGLDGVLVATQSVTHADAALPYIDAGIPTFIEKPMATTISDAERIRDAAARSGAIVFVGHIFLFHPAFVAALKLLPSLGTIRYVLCEGANNRPRTDSSVLWDWLPHHLSMANAIFGRGPDSAAGWSLSQDGRLEAALAKFRFGNTPMVSTVSWRSSIPRKCVAVNCEKATLVFDDTAAQRLALYDQQGSVAHPSYSAELPLTREMEAFLQAIRSGRVEAAHIELGMEIVRAIAAAERSIALGGQPVAVQ